MLHQGMAFCAWLAAETPLGLWEGEHGQPVGRRLWAS